MKEEGWGLGEALLGWGHHLGHRVWAQGRVGTHRAGYGHCLSKYQGPVAHTHICTEGLEVNPDPPLTPVHPAHPNLFFLVASRVL